MLSACFNNSTRVYTATFHMCDVTINTKYIQTHARVISSCWFCSIVWSILPYIVVCWGILLRCVKHMTKRLRHSPRPQPTEASKRSRFNISECCDTLMCSKDHYMTSIYISIYDVYIKSICKNSFLCNPIYLYLKVLMYASRQSHIPKHERSNKEGTYKAY